GATVTMDPKRVRLIALAAGIPILFVLAVSFAGGAGKKKGIGPVVVVTNSGASGTARPSSTEIGLTLEQLMKTGGPPATGVASVSTPSLPPADPKEVAALMDKGERSYMSGDLASARGYYDRAH